MSLPPAPQGRLWRVAVVMVAAVVFACLAFPSGWFGVSRMSGEGLRAVGQAAVVLGGFGLPVLAWSFLAEDRWRDVSIGLSLIALPTTWYLYGTVPGDRTFDLLAPKALLYLILAMLLLAASAWNGWRSVAWVSSLGAAVVGCCWYLPDTASGTTRPGEGEVLPLPAGLTLVRMGPYHWDGCLLYTKDTCGSAYDIRFEGMSRDRAILLLIRHLHRDKGWGSYPGASADECRDVGPPMRSQSKICVVWPQCPGVTRAHHPDDISFGIVVTTREAVREGPFCRSVYGMVSAGPG